MIQRLDLKCPGCGSSIRLRISVGNQPRQSFFFPCNVCTAITHGSIELSDEGIPNITVNCERIQIEAPDQCITLDPELPSLVKAGSIADLGGSPFLLQTQLMGNGESFTGYLAQLKQLRELIANDGDAYLRLVGYYLNRDWKMVNKQGTELIGDKWPNPTNDLQFHDAVHRVTEMVFARMFPRWMYPKLKAEHSKLITALSRTQSTELAAFASGIVTNQRYIQLEKDLFGRLEWILRNFDLFAPALAIDAYLPAHRQNLGALRRTARGRPATTQ